jgi:hypothetical protein
MTGADDTLVDLVDLDEFERLFEQALAPEGPGDLSGPDDRPAWVDDLAHLVAEARSAPTDDELRASPAVVAAMVAERHMALAAVPDLAADDVGGDPAPRHDDGYSPRHISAAPPATPAGRQVRRVIAVKAVAIATAVAVGTVAAAAATTGIVSSVVDRVTHQPAPAGIDGTPADESGDTTDGIEDGGTIDISTSGCPEVEPLCSPVHGMAAEPGSGDEATGAGGATDPQADEVTSDTEADDASATATPDSTVAVDGLEPAGAAETGPTTSTSTTPTTAAPTTAPTTSQPGPTTTADDTLPPQARENRNERAGQKGPP